MKELIGNFPSTVLLFCLLIDCNIVVFGQLYTDKQNITEISGTQIGSAARKLHDRDNSNNIPVNIQLKPAHYLHGKDYVSTGLNLTATAEILDEKFKNLSITYQWSVRNKTIITNSIASHIIYRFDEPADDNFLKVLVDSPPYSGVSVKNLVIREPLSIADPIGKLFIEHGEMLNVRMKFNGTGPFTYCYQFCLQIGADEQCKKCSRFASTKLDEVNISYYLRSVGNYSLLFVVDNVASHLEKDYSVRVQENTREPSLPYVPIVSSISAAFILLAGLVLHLNSKRTLYTETADFDFIRQVREEDEADEFDQITFWQRARYSLFKRGSEQDGQGGMSNSHLNQSRSRLI